MKIPNLLRKTHFSRTLPPRHIFTINNPSWNGVLCDSRSPRFSIKDINSSAFSLPFLHFLYFLPLSRFKYFSWQKNFSSEIKFPSIGVPIVFRYIIKGNFFELPEILFLKKKEKKKVLWLWVTWHFSTVSNLSFPLPLPTLLLPYTLFFSEFYSFNSFYTVSHALVVIFFFFLVLL